MKLKKNLWLTALFIFVLFPLLFGSLNVPGLGNVSDFTYRLSRLGALLGLVFFTVQIVLAAKLKFIETYFGQDKMIALHRGFGWAALVLILFHGLSALQVATGRNETGLLLGIVAFFLFLVTTFFIFIHKVFHTQYELWEIAHQINYILFPLAFIHSALLGSSIRYSPVWQTLWALLGLCFIGIVIYKIRNSYRVAKNRYEIVKVFRETPNIWSIHFKPRRFDFVPGQFLTLRLIQNGHTSEPHPFTISSSPTAETFSVSIKTLGDFTRKAAQVKTGDYALIDAPYGRFSFLMFPAEEYIFIAGGIGITPFMSMLRYMRDKGINKRVLLLWGNKTEQDIAFRGELAEMENSTPSLKVVHILSQESEWAGEKGFINAGILRKYGGNLSGKEIFLCGPPVMMGMVLKELETLNVPKRKIHFERFSF